MQDLRIRYDLERGGMTDRSLHGSFIYSLLIPKELANTQSSRQHMSSYIEEGEA